MTEHQIQSAFIQWFRIMHKDCFVFSIPNGEHRAISVAKRLKREGVVAGIPDLQVLMPNSKNFFIELKTEKGRLSKSQKETIPFMQEKGHQVIVCFGLDDTIKKTSKIIHEIKYTNEVDCDLCEHQDIIIENKEVEND